MNTIDLEKMKFDLRKEAQRGNDLLEQVRGDMEQVKKELAEMETKLPGLFAQFYLKEIPGAEIARTKKRRRKLREFLDDYPFTSVGLGDHLKTLSTRGSQIFLLEKQVRRYETLKNGLSNRNWTDLENQLLGLGHEIVALDDARAFLDSLKQEVKT